MNSEDVNDPILKLYGLREKKLKILRKNQSQGRSFLLNDNWYFYFLTSWI